MPPSPPQLRALERVQTNRARPGRDLSIKGLIARTAADATRAQRRLGELAALWEEIVPAQISRHTAFTGLHRGVLAVAFDSSAAGFELDRFLRGGGEDELRRRYRGSLVRIKTRLAPWAQSEPSPRNRQRA